MAAVPLELRATPTDRSLLESLSKFSAVGLDDVLAQGGASRTRRVPVPGAAVSFGYRWRLADEWSGTWWPQGIALGEHQGTRVALVSWYAQPRHGIRMGSRVSVVNLSDTDRPTYRHILLVEPRKSDAAVTVEAVQAHAGGIAWSGDRLLVAATFDGIREFRLSDILRADRRRDRPFGYEFVLPQFAHHRTIDGSAANRMRYSFLTLETGADLAAAPGLKLVAGEYDRGDGQRVARLTYTPKRTLVDETHVPRIARMQGAALHEGTWYISASRGEHHGGDLWSGPIGNLRRGAGVMPPGPEALAVCPERDELWSVSEIRGKRWIFAMNLPPDR